MEALAFTHVHAAHEEVSLNPDAYELTLFKGLNWQPPSSAWIGLLAALAAVSILSTTGNAFAIGSGRYYVASSSLNVRNSPNGYVVKTLGYGQAVDLTGYTSGPWAQTVPGNWVYTSYLR